MTGNRRPEQPEGRTRLPLRPRQPHSLVALRPSQRRAAERRAALERERAAESWLRRLARR
jgi:hypothetical protein